MNYQSKVGWKPTKAERGRKGKESPFTKGRPQDMHRTKKPKRCYCGGHSRGKQNAKPKKKESEKE